jgi:hypothetical protein
LTKLTWASGAQNMELVFHNIIENLIKLVAFVALNLNNILLLNKHSMRHEINPPDRGKCHAGFC